jgi:hypothetical protein
LDQLFELFNGVLFAHHLQNICASIVFASIHCCAYYLRFLFKVPQIAVIRSTHVVDVLGSYFDLLSLEVDLTFSILNTLLVLPYYAHCLILISCIPLLFVYYYLHTICALYL